ncbi:uncharacterized protein FTOL_07976 [Fusarium torulosum]|uniref:Uncharacterized protein n=1 Tax=Fusarium torulosum TaxID=33205 RepID=A0AAE8SK16_9HYPO|nr:uncharacterized protein FTOL_07976 [Fusarium torulosum]
MTCLGDGLLAELIVARAGDFLLTVLAEGMVAVAGEGTRSLTTGAEVDGNGDRGILGVDATWGAEVKDTPFEALSGALSGSGLLTTIARTESGVGARIGEATLEVEVLGTAADEGAGDMGSDGAAGLGLSPSMSMTRLQ